jgi:alkylation response protein AidB-like acyl-CoA dehydrogenase
MNIELSDEQLSLKKVTRDLLSRAYDYERVAQAAGSAQGWTAEIWKHLADMGILGLCVAEEYGGAAAGPVELAAVVEELGRVLAPEPVLDSAVLPADLIGQTGTADQVRTWLPALASGDRLGAVAHHEQGDRWPMRRVSTEATDQGDILTLSGTKVLVRQGHCADVLVVSARLDGQIELFLVDTAQPSVRRTLYHSHDRSRGAHVEFIGAAAEILPRNSPTDALAHTQALAQTALFAEAVGAMDAMLSLTVDYLKTRKQFGTPLANFQSLTHRAADLFVRVELARSMSALATAKLADGYVDTVLNSRAALQICRSARAIAHECIHMHGGIGVTQEHPVGHFASRLVSIEHQLGGADAHLSLLAAGVDNYETVGVGAV